jgi:hypothetical protein
MRDNESEEEQGKKGRSDLIVYIRHEAWTKVVALEKITNLGTV